MDFPKRGIFFILTLAISYQLNSDTFCEYLFSRYVLLAELNFWIDNRLPSSEYDGQIQESARRVRDLGRSREQIETELRTELGAALFEAITQGLEYALGKGLFREAFSQGPEAMADAIRALSKLSGLKFNSFIEDLRAFYEGGPLVSFRDAIEMFRETYGVLVSEEEEFEINYKRLPLYGPKYQYRNILLGIRPFILQAVPSLEELKMVIPLGFELAIERQKESGEWIIIMGTGRFVEEDLSPAELAILPVENKQIDSFIHNQPSGDYHPSELDLKSAREHPGRENFILTAQGLAIFNQQGIVKIVPWDEVRVELYNFGPQSRRG